MPGKLVEITNNIYKKETTEADFVHPTGILADVIVILNSGHVSSRIVPTGFYYESGDYQLEVYLNGQYIRAYEWINSVQYGEYEEWTNYSIRFKGGGYIKSGDIVRFRVTSANYSAVFSRSTGSGGAFGHIIEQLEESTEQNKNDISQLQTDLDLAENNLNQLGKESFGDDYTFSGTGTPQTRTIGVMSNGDVTPDISGYRTWNTALSGTVTITNLDECRADDLKYIIFSNNNTTIQNNSNIKIQGGVDFNGNTGDTIVLIYDGSSWYEISRSLNS